MCLFAADDYYGMGRLTAQCTSLYEQPSRLVVQDTSQDICLLAANTDVPANLMVEDRMGINLFGEINFIPEAIACQYNPPIHFTNINQIHCDVPYKIDTCKSTDWSFEFFVGVNIFYKILQANVYRA